MAVLLKEFLATHYDVSRLAALTLMEQLASYQLTIVDTMDYANNSVLVAILVILR